MLDLLKRNNKIIVNTDIDGVLSAFVLCKYCNCEIVGFSNSTDCVWWQRDKIGSIYDGVYIDMYVPRQDVLTIDQHIIAYDEEERARIAALGTKLNPNLENPRTFEPADSYKYKYPFATVHYILAKLGGAGMEIGFDLGRKIKQDGCGDLCLGDFVLRADDAAKTTLNSPYKKNARDWWGWLLSQAGSTRNVRNLVEFLEKCPSDEESVETKKSDIKRFFGRRYGCRKSDGGFKKPCDENGNLTEAARRYFSDFWNYLDGDVTDIKQSMTAKYDCATGVAKRIWIRPNEAAELKSEGKVGGEVVFSYGYVNSPGGRLPNFSYTVM